MQDDQEKELMPDGGEGADGTSAGEVCANCGGPNDRKEQNLPTCSACEIGTGQIS